VKLVEQQLNSESVAIRFNRQLRSLKTLNRKEKPELLFCVVFAGILAWFAFGNWFAVALACFLVWQVRASAFRVEHRILKESVLSLSDHYPEEASDALHRHNAMTMIEKAERRWFRK